MFFPLFLMLGLSCVEAGLLPDVEIVNRDSGDQQQIN